MTGSAVIAAGIYKFNLNQAINQLPSNWQKSPSLRKHKLGVSLLFGYLVNHFMFEFAAHSLSWYGFYTSFIYTISLTIASALMLGFLWIHTRTPWKRYAYPLLYIFIVARFIYGGYFHPRSIFDMTIILLYFCTYFLSALLLLTDLLMQPKMEYFKFQLKVCILLLVYTLLASIISTFVWSVQTKEYLKLFDFLHLAVAGFFYLGMAFIFGTEILKLRRG